MRYRIVHKAKAALLTVSTTAVFFAAEPGAPWETDSRVLARAQMPRRCQAGT